MQVSKTNGKVLRQTSAGMIGSAGDPIGSTGFTAPAYSATERTSQTSRPSGIFGAIGFTLGTLFGFQGRISRMDYWLIGSAYTFTAILGYASFAQTFGTWSWPHLIAEAEAQGELVKFYLFSFLMIMLRLSLEARRFQDRDLSGYWYFGYLVPGLNLYLLVSNSFRMGTRGGNRYDL